MIKSAVLAVATAATMLGATSAHAGVRWSVGINLPVPVIGAVVASGPVYGPSYYGYAPVPVYAPVQVYAAPAFGVGYYPRPAYYRPVRVAYPYHGRPGWR
jgi:hypothetical protein